MKICDLRVSKRGQSAPVAWHAGVTQQTPKKPKIGYQHVKIQLQDVTMLREYLSYLLGCFHSLCHFIPVARSCNKVHPSVTSVTFSLSNNFNCTQKDRDLLW